MTAWVPADIEAAVRQWAAENGKPFGAVCQALRVILTGSTKSPPIFDCMYALGQDETVARLRAGYEDWLTLQARDAEVMNVCS